MFVFWFKWEQENLLSTSTDLYQVKNVSCLEIVMNILFHTFFWPVNVRHLKFLKILAFSLKKVFLIKRTTFLTLGQNKFQNKIPLICFESLCHKLWHCGCSISQTKYLFFRSLNLLKSAYYYHRVVFYSPMRKIYLTILLNKKHVFLLAYRKLADFTGLSSSLSAKKFP